MQDVELGEELYYLAQEYFQTINEKLELEASVYDVDGNQLV